MTAADRPSRIARAVLGAGLVVFVAVLAGFAFLARLPLLDAILLAALLVAVPVSALAQLPFLDDLYVERIPIYWASIASIGFIGVAAWLVGTRDAGPGVGLGTIAAAPLVLWALGLTVAGLATITLFREVATRIGTPDTPLLRELLPRTGRERGVFALLSVSAGFGEELAYRGYAISALAPITGVGGAAVVASVTFGVVHGYQGVLGMVRTGVMGGVLAWGFLASGSLWPGIVAHTLIDVLAGIVLGERLLSPERSAGVSEPASLPIEPS